MNYWADYTFNKFYCLLKMNFFYNAVSAFTRNALHMLQESVCVTPHDDPNQNQGSHTFYLNISRRFPPNTLQREYYMNIASAYLDYNNEVYHDEYGYCDV